MTTSYGGGGVAVDADRRRRTAARRVVLTEVDVSNPAAMAVRRTMQLDGALVDARLHGGTARVVVALVAAAGRARRRSRAPALRRFVPRTTLRSRVSGRTFRRSVVACDDVRHPRAFSGPGPADAC